MALSRPVARSLARSLAQSWCKLFSVYGKAFTHSAEWDGTTDASGRRAYRNPTRASLRAKLLATEGVTSYLGRTVRVRAAEPRAFRKMVDEYTDSADAVEEGALWPLVKQVRLYSARWRALRAGTVLIDAPGLNDDNAARDCIVKAALRDADSVWICSNAGRAVNDRTAHNLLNDSFRRCEAARARGALVVLVAWACCRALCVCPLCV
jgi:hypothetical protein